MRRFTTTPQGLDISLLWVPRGHVALVSVVLEGTLAECRQINGFCVLLTVASLRISMVNFYPRPRHTREGGRNLNPQSIALASIFCLPILLALRLRATPALYRPSVGFPPIWCVTARQGLIFERRIKSTQGMPNHKKTSVDKPSD